MTKKILSSLLILAVVLTVSGCYQRVKDRNELIKYANDTYGAGTFEGSKKKLKGNESYTTIIMKDKDTEIRYTVTSSLVNVSVDGSTFVYQEQTVSDFEEKYYEYLLDLAESDLENLASDYGFTYELNYGVFKINFSDRDSAEKAEEAVTEFDQVLTRYDIKDLRPKEYLIYVDETIYVGAYDASTDMYSEAADFDIIDYVHENYDPEAVYLDSMYSFIDQFLSYEEIQKLFPDHDSSPSGNAYYFKDKNGETFVAIDLKEFGANEEGIRLFRDTASGMEEIDY